MLDWPIYLGVFGKKYGGWQSQATLRGPLPLSEGNSQIVKLRPMIGGHREIDERKKGNGRKWHPLVDVLGRMYGTHVLAAHAHDSPSGGPLLEGGGPDLNNLKEIMAEKFYRSTFAKAVDKKGILFEVIERAEGVGGFLLETKRWVVERTFAG